MPARSSDLLAQRDRKGQKVTRGTAPKWVKGQIRHQRLRPRSGTTLMQTRRAGSRVRKALPDRLGHKAIKVLLARQDLKA